MKNNIRLHSPNLDSNNVPRRSNRKKNAKSSEKSIYLDDSQNEIDVKKLIKKN